MFGSDEKLDNEGLKKVLKDEKKNLLEVTHRIFWNSLFIDAYKLIGLNNCKSSTKSLSYYMVRDYVDRFLVDLSKKCNLETTMQNQAAGTEYRLSFIHLNEEYFSDSVIIFIGFASIELRMLSGLFIETFALEDYEMMERLVSEVCNQLYEKGKLSELLYEHLRLEESDSNLTVKTVEIAQNSIRAIYNGKATSFYDLKQKYLYSDLYFRGKNIRVLHKEFLEAPEDLMKELEKL